ncbi:MAG: DUF5667 domain-containing protein [bacterium]|nr:DUF5667 domain-containing protein [bacterium]
MDNLEKILANLPKPKLRLKADLKIKSKLYYLILSKRLEKLFSQPAPRGQVYILKNSLAIALMIIIIFSGTSIYAYSSGEVMPGNRLYSLKRAMEKVEQQASITPAAKSQTYQKFSQRRLEEALRLSRRKSSGGQISNADNQQVSANIQKNIAEAVSNLITAADTAAAIKNQAESLAAQSRITERADSEVKYLNQIAAFAAFADDQEILDKVSDAKTAINQYQNASLDDNRSDEPEEKNLNQINNNTASQAEPARQIEQTRENKETKSERKYSPRQRREKKTNADQDNQKPPARIQGVKINGGSEARPVQTAASSPNSVPGPSDSRLENGQPPQTDEQSQPPEKPEDNRSAAEIAPPEPKPATINIQPVQEQKDATEQTKEISSFTGATSTPARQDDSFRKSDSNDDDHEEEESTDIAATTPEKSTATTTSRDREND